LPRSINTQSDEEDSDMTIASSATDPASSAVALRSRSSHPGAWRLFTAAPAMIASFLLLVLILSAMGRWEAIALAAWLSCGAAALTRHGERAAVTSTLGFRRPNGIQTEALEAVWATTLGRARIASTEAELYVQRSCEQNAYAAGKRSVAVTSGLLQEFSARRLSEEQMVGLLLHDLLTAPVTAMPEMAAA
jgi:STE24 endopeptidase